MPRPSPMSTPYQSDDEDGIHYNDEGENEAVQGLLWMAGIQTSHDTDFGQMTVADM